jgi:hypothetical protein
MRYGNKEPVADRIVWRILKDSESIDLGMPDIDGLNQFRILISMKTQIWAMYTLQNSSLTPPRAMPR